MKKQPLYVEIREDLLNKIENGIYEVGDLIPKEVDLAKEYNVSRPTVRQAIQQLVHEGLLERKKKLGTIVKQPKIYQEFTHVIESYDSEMLRKGLAPSTQVLTFRKELANEEVAENLEITVTDTVYKLVRLRYTEEEPIVLVTTYIPASSSLVLDEVDFTTTRLYDVLEGKGYPVRSVTRKLDVLLADETTSDLLNIPEADPIFYFHTVAYSDDDYPVEYSISKYRGDLNSFVFKVNT